MTTSKGSIFNRRHGVHFRPSLTERTHLAQVNVLNLITALDGPTTTAPHDAPDVVGMRLSDSLRTLAAFGATVVSEDLLQTAGMPRQILTPNNWKVITQRCRATGEVGLGVLKCGETVPDGRSRHMA
jgi:hypothetical protein